MQCWPYHASVRQKKVPCFLRNTRNLPSPRLGGPQTDLLTGSSYASTIVSSAVPLSTHSTLATAHNSSKISFPLGTLRPVTFVTLTMAIRSERFTNSALGGAGYGGTAFTEGASTHTLIIPIRTNCRACFTLSPQQIPPSTSIVIAPCLVRSARLPVAPGATLRHSSRHTPMSESNYPEGS